MNHMDEPVPVVADRLEDLAFLADNGATLDEAAARFLVRPRSLWNWLTIHGGQQVRSQLVANGRRH